MFALAIATSLIPLLALNRLQLHVTGDRRRVLRQALAPSLGVQAVLLALFVLRLVPPVPLSLMEIGIYHDVVRDQSGAYEVRRLPASWWTFWSTDDRTFLARPGDRVFCFFRVFAPIRFEDEVRVHWAYWQAGDGWVSSDAVPVVVRGGHERGFAGYTYKQNWRPGDWRVTIETTDGREIGRRAFMVKRDDEQAERQLLTDVR
jgi:hypothetical protein